MIAMDKSFNDFLRQVDLNSLLYDCNRFGISSEVQECPFSKEQSAYVANLVVGFSLAILQAYHDWDSKGPS